MRSRYDHFLVCIGSYEYKSFFYVLAQCQLKSTMLLSKANVHVNAFNTHFRGFKSPLLMQYSSSTWHLWRDISEISRFGNIGA